MLHESSGDIDKAKEIYNELISINPNDVQTIKRLAALERDQGNLNEAVNLLNNYIEANQTDVEAWLELTDLYLSRQNFDKAQYCYEEILTMQPTNYMINIRYAEILYSTSNGGEYFENLLNARKYFSHALALQSDKQDKTQTRALWGLLKTCKTIESLNKKEEEKNTEIIRTCQERLREIYGGAKGSAKSINIDSMKLM